MRGRRWVLIGGAAAAMFSVVAILVTRARRGAPIPPRLVVLYAPCTVNRDYLSPYNPAVTYTPHLAAFAASGLVFTKHETEEAQSGIAYASILSGSQAMRHGVYYHPMRLDDGLYLISEAFRDGGYETYFWADHDFASPGLNYGQGVDPSRIYWDKHRFRAIATQSGAFLRGDDPRFRSVLAELRDHPHAKAFLLTAFSVTHMVYNSRHLDEFCQAFPAECAGSSNQDLHASAALFTEYGGRLGIDFAATVASLGWSSAQVAQVIRAAELLYESNIYFLDQLFGGVVDAIKEYGLLDQSLIAFTADHGEVLYRKNAPLYWAHGFMLAPDDIRAPLILRGPGITVGRYTGVTRSIDIYPTLAGLAGLTLPRDAVMGVDLSAVVRGAAPPPDLIAFSHTSLVPPGAPNVKIPGLPTPPSWIAGPSGLSVAARHGDLEYKLTTNDGETTHVHVYNWETDPTESADLYDPQDEGQRAMVRQLGEYKQALSEGFERRRAAGAMRPLTEHEKEALHALGYTK